MKVRVGVLSLSASWLFWAAPIFAQEQASVAQPTSEPPPGSEDRENAASAAAAPLVTEQYSSSAMLETSPEEPASPGKEPPPYDKYDSDDDDEEDGPQKAKNAIYLEGFGAAITYSLNYERLFEDAIAARIGVSFISATVSSGTSSSNSTLVAVPLTVSWVGLYSGSHGLELGGGSTLFFTSAGSSIGTQTASANGVVPSAVGFVGYRLHPVNKVGVQFRVGAEAIVFFNGPQVVAQPWGYISLGAAF